MPDQQMVGLYDYMDDYLVKGIRRTAVNALLSNGGEPANYPVQVFTVADALIGTAYTKEQFMTIWNSSAANREVGLLTGWYGPFTFEISYRCGSTIPRFLGVGGFTPSRHHIFSKQFSTVFA